MTVEKVCDELTGGLKVLSNWEIACSPRNTFRGSLREQPAEVERLDRQRGPQGRRVEPNSECRGHCPGRKTSSDNIRSQKEKNPDRQLRSQTHAQFERKSGCDDIQDVGLEAAII